VPDAPVIAESQNEISEDHPSSESKLFENKTPITSVSKSAKVKAFKASKPVNKQGISTFKANLATSSLAQSKGKSKVQQKPKHFQKGQVDFRKSEPHKKKKNKVLRTNQRGPIRIWVPKSEIMYTTGMHPKKKRKLLVSRQWMLSTHDRRQALVPHPESARGWNSRIWWEPERKNHWYRYSW
jgi:hypothetical protein